MIIVIAASDVPPESCVMKEQTGTTHRLKDQHQESTYTLLIRSEDKSRSVFEVVIYPLLILGPLIAIWQFAQQPVNNRYRGSGAGRHSARIRRSRRRTHYAHVATERRQAETIRPALRVSPNICRVTPNAASRGSVDPPRGRSYN